MSSSIAITQCSANTALCMCTDFSNCQWLKPSKHIILTPSPVLSGFLPKPDRHSWRLSLTNSMLSKPFMLTSGRSDLVTRICVESETSARRANHWSMHRVHHWFWSTDLRQVSISHTSNLWRVKWRSHPTHRMCSLESSCVHGENHGKRKRPTGKNQSIRWEFSASIPAQRCNPPSALLPITTPRHVWNPTFIPKKAQGVHNTTKFERKEISKPAQNPNQPRLLSTSYMIAAAFIIMLVRVPGIEIVPALILRLTYHVPVRSCWTSRRRILSHRLCHFSHLGQSLSQLTKREFSPKTGIRGGSVLTDQNSFRWVNKLLHWLTWNLDV